MKIPRNARYRYCVNMAHEFLLKEDIRSFPIDMESLIVKHKWALINYSRLAEKHKLSIEDVKDAFSDDGYSIYNKYNYTIAYNDTVASKDRIYFTQTHEVGHIDLKHFISFDQTILLRSTLTEAEYKVLENEANCYARNVVAPAAVVQALGITRPSELANIFGISLDAAKVRLSFLQTDLNRLSKAQKKKQLEVFHDFIHKKACLNCGSSFVAKDAEFCPICGEADIEWGEGSLFYRDGFPLDANGRFDICPSCRNLEAPSGSERCSKCGAIQVNRCTNTEDFFDACGAIASGNARYCVHCGSKTTFFKQNYLWPWGLAKYILSLHTKK